MQKEIRKIDTIHGCSGFFSDRTCQPLAGIVRPDDKYAGNLLRLGLYSVILDRKPGSCCSGWKECDFSAGTVAFAQPGTPVCMGPVEKDKCRILLFHPEFIAGTALAGSMRGYSFFRYRCNEALHVSERELCTMQDCMDSIEKDLRWGTDEFSHGIITERIRLMLDYGARFYKRQFITRHEENCTVIRQADSILDKYFLTGQVLKKGLPTASFLSRALGISAAYLEDLLTCETGKGIAEYIGSKQFCTACNLLCRTDKSIQEISMETGYCSMEHFCEIFRRLTGHSPGRDSAHI